MTQKEKKKSESEFDLLAKIPKGIVIGFVLLLLSIAIILVSFGSFSISKLCIVGIWVGGLLTLFGYYHLVYVLPIMGKDVDARISMESLQASFWLVMLGLVIIVLSLVLGFLFLMYG